MQFKVWLEQLSSVRALQQLLPQLVQAAQQVYNAWEQNDDGYDEEYGGGGICHDIADAMADALNSRGIEAVTFHNTVDENHVWVIAQFAEGIYSIDIPPSVYESGGGYTWRKIPDVVFQPNHIGVMQISQNPADFEQYTDGGW